MWNDRWTDTQDLHVFGSLRSQEILNLSLIILDSNMPRIKDTAVLSKKTSTSWRRRRKTRQSRTRGLKPTIITSIRLRGILLRRPITNWFRQTSDRTAERAPSFTGHLPNYTKGSGFTLPSPTTSCKITKLIRNQQVLRLKTNPRWRWSCQLNH